MEKKLKWMVMVILMSIDELVRWSGASMSIKLLLKLNVLIDQLTRKGKKKREDLEIWECEKN